MNLSDILVARGLVSLEDIQRAGEHQRENREEAGVTHGVYSLFRGVERNRRKPYPRTGACDPGGDDTRPFGLGFERPEDASRAVEPVSRRPIPSGERDTLGMSWRGTSFLAKP